MAKQEFWMPSIEEQKKIVSILWSIENNIVKIERVSKINENMKKGLLSNLLFRGIDNSHIKNTEIEKIPDNWNSDVFKNCIKRKKVTQSTKIKVTDYLEHGKYPIIDQSQNDISGYINDKNKLYCGELPVIIFGDHTRIVKYVNFDFALGADGIKLIYPNRKLFVHKYFYYVLCNFDIENHGYQRHYKYLQDEKVLIPPIEEQKKIVNILEQIDKTIEIYGKHLDKSNQIKKKLTNDYLSGKLIIPKEVL